MTFGGEGSFEGGRVRSHKGAVAGGGVGILGIIGFLIYQFTGVDVGPALEQLEGGGGGGGAAPGGQAGTIAECTVEQANEQRDCRLSATVQFLDEYWTEVFASQGELPLPDVTSFSGGVSTGCGQASSATGPFYCPPDQGIYMDLTFFDLLSSRFGASGGPLAEIYVTAHEYGHHIQNVTGVMERAIRQGTGADSDAVRVELQADCYAGMFVGNATGVTVTNEQTGARQRIEPITPEQLADAQSAAEAVGDDHIQAQSGGGVNPDTWTHGSSEQRQHWFTVGYNEGSLQACDTFATDQL